MINAFEILGAAVIMFSSFEVELISNVLAPLVKNCFFQSQPFFDASAIIFLEKNYENHVSGHRPPYQLAIGFVL